MAPYHNWHAIGYAPDAVNERTQERIQFRLDSVERVKTRGSGGQSRGESGMWGITSHFGPLPRIGVDLP